jgi:membrane protein YdbS with pleckstrin-like domain
MMAKEQFDGSGITGFAWLLGISLVLLKAAGATDWPWWAITLPFWAPFAIALLLFFSGMLLVVIGASVQKYSERHSKDEDADGTV